MRGNLGVPPKPGHRKGAGTSVEHWLQPIVVSRFRFLFSFSFMRHETDNSLPLQAQDFKRLSSECCRSLRGQLDSKEWSRMAQERLKELEDLNLKGRPQYTRLREHVLARLKKYSEDDGIQRQAVAGLEAVVRICEYANAKGLGATMLQFYMVSSLRSSFLVPYEMND